MLVRGASTALQNFVTGTPSRLQTRTSSGSSPGTGHCSFFQETSPSRSLSRREIHL